MLDTKKKILIIMPSMFIGGAERSLLGLLGEIDYEIYDVSLFLYRHEGEFLSLIPESVNLLAEDPHYRTFDTPIRSLLLTKKCMYGIARLCSKLALKIHCLVSKEVPGVWMNMQYTSRFLQPLLPKISGNYDLGIMFLGVADTLNNKVNAKIRMTWCHTDYSTLGPDRKIDMETYSYVDKIAFVSKSCKAQMEKMYPELSEKSMVFENVLAGNLIQTFANDNIEDMPRDEGVINLVSVGRFCEAKNFDNIPEICSKIRELGVNTKWYLIGYGADEELIRAKIKEFCMEEYVIILGKKDNPYPYINCCDYYLQPSRYEGKCVSVREAQTLGKPVIITDYATSRDQVEDGIDGFIVPMQNEACAEKIVEILQRPDLTARVIENVKKRDYSNKAELRKIDEILGQKTLSERVGSVEDN